MAKVDMSKSYNLKHQMIDSIFNSARYILEDQNWFCKTCYYYTLVIYLNHVSGPIWKPSMKLPVFSVIKSMGIAFTHPVKKNV